jgi:hypothetical protein
MREYGFKITFQETSTAQNIPQWAQARRNQSQGASHSKPGKYRELMLQGCGRQDL